MNVKFIQQYFMDTLRTFLSFLKNYTLNYYKIIFISIETVVTTFHLTTPKKANCKLHWMIQTSGEVQQNQQLRETEDDSAWLNALLPEVSSLH